MPLLCMRYYVSFHPISAGITENEFVHQLEMHALLKLIKERKIEEHLQYLHNL